MKRFLIPVVAFAVLGALLYAGLSLDPRKIPSPLVGKPLPAFELATVADSAKRVSHLDLRGRAYLLNVWASWCAACRDEHPLLNQIARNKLVPIVGFNYKDKREDAIGWLNALGNPYELSVSDLDGRVGIELGVYGVPETFLVDKAGTIRYKHIGPITPKVWEEQLLPVLRQLG